MRLTTRLLPFTGMLLRSWPRCRRSRVVAVMSHLPRSGAQTEVVFTIDSLPAPEPNEEPDAWVQVVNPAYFSTLAMPIARGRGVALGDRGDAPPVVVVNESFVRRHFPEGGAIGERLTLYGESRAIVGCCG